MICKKCGKIGNKFGHIVYAADSDKPNYYHWECFDKDYNDKINLILKDSHKND